MIVYLDENMPKHLADGFHTLQYYEGLKTGQRLEVKHIPTEFEKGIKDPAWIPILGKQKACVITQDVNLHRRRHELELYRQNKIGLFLLRGKSKKQGMSVWQMVQALAKNWPDITNAIFNDDRPFAFEVTLHRKMKKLP